MDTSTVLMKHAAAVHINNQLTMNQRKVANILLLNAYDAGANKSWYTMPVRDLLLNLGWKDSSNTTELLKEDLRVLNSLQLEWNILRRDRKNTWGVTTFLADAKIENGVVLYSYSLTMQSLLFNPNTYAKLNLSVQRCFNTKYSLILWEMLCCELSISKRDSIKSVKFTVDELKQLFGVHDKKAYSTFRAINQKILSPAIDEVNSKSDIDVEISLEKIGKSVNSVLFAIKKKAAEKCGSLEVKILLLSKILGISYDQVVHDVSVYGIDRVSIALEITNKQIHNGVTIHNVVAFYRSALKGNWVDELSVSDVKQNIQIEHAEAVAKKVVRPDYVQSIMEQIKASMSAKIFSSWFSDFEFVSLDYFTITFKVESKFKKDYIEANYINNINSAVNNVLGNKSVEIIC